MFSMPLCQRNTLARHGDGWRLASSIIVNRQWHCFGTLLFAISILVGPGVPTVLAAKPAAKQARIQQDFLPPVATINDSLQSSPSSLGTSDATDSNPEDGDLEAITLSAVTTPTLQLSDPTQRIHQTLSTAQEHRQAFLKLQQGVDEEDMQNLWNAVVERNPVIRFSLEKLAMPVDTQAKQSSRFVKKTLNVLISGAVMGATMLPGVGSAGNYYQNLGAVTGGDVLRNLVNGKQQPTSGAVLSSTEQIQLAALIDQLRGSLIQSYHEYKATLQSLSAAEQTANTANTAYAKALEGKDPLGIMITASAYYKAQTQETHLMQKAKCLRLQLERLAGTEAVSQLAFLPNPNAPTETAVADPASPGARPHRPTGKSGTTARKSAKPAAKPLKKAARDDHDTN
jgi:hypothetical protein